jgi:peptide/nickel transport system permease protein
MTTVAERPGASSSAVPQARKRPHPIRHFILHRSAWGVVSVAAVAVIVYFATIILPGDAATAILGQQATPERLALLRKQLGLDQPVIPAFWHWITGFIRGDFGTSLSPGATPVWDLVAPRLANSAFLVVVAGLLSTILGIVTGAVAAARRDKVSDHLMSVGALVANSLPEFIIGIFVVLVFGVRLKVFPAISFLPPGTFIWEEPNKLVLPVLTLVIVVTPYCFRMVRASTIEALLSDYAEMASLKGADPRRILFAHALPNALAPAIQVVGLNLLYLAGGIVLVETVFAFPGIGSLLVNSIQTRDIPVVQFLTVFLAVFYVALNICTDIAVLLVTPRRRLPR